MTYGERMTQILAQRHKAINSLVEGLKSKMGEDIPNEAVVATFITLAQKLGNFYRFFELESKMIFALQTEINTLALTVEEPANNE